ncbi:MAG TPA: response regulator transcription factor [Verrucomicrobiota bacterium]|nr:response regulator transcription factor [Verrucomicrobiota bacterium]
MKPVPPATVLIADDHPIFRRGLRGIIAGDSTLRLAGEAADGEQAWRLIQELRPTLAVLDNHMPKLTGLQVGRLVFQHRVPVALIMLTVDTEEALLNKALNLGFKGYLLKETAAADLLQAVHAVAKGNAYVTPALSDALIRRQRAGIELRAQKPGLDKLSPSERAVLKLIAEDRTSKEIAALLGCSHRTVDTHRQHISQKLELSGTHSLLRFAFDHKSEL